MPAGAAASRLTAASLPQRVRAIRTPQAIERGGEAAVDRIGEPDGIDKLAARKGEAGKRDEIGQLHGFLRSGNRTSTSSLEL